ncbi:MAG TPA: AMP-binding protein [Pseudonocardia sp.]|jgi:non-ribosomal peptide synthetase component E (peptide arylation enzyme)|nr:AMP-binding protein [Pseudonocardia sp.]
MNVADHTPPEVRRRWSDEGHYDDLDQYAAFRRQVTMRGDQVAVVDGTSQVTYDELLIATHRLANMLVDAGVVAGDVVAVQLPNRWECCALDYAIAAIGAVCLPFPINYRERELRELMGRSGAAAYVTIDGYRDYDSLGTIQHLLTELPHLRHVFALGGSGGTAWAGVHSVDEALAGGAPADWVPTPIDPNLPCRIGVTSGTEAVPKMVVNSHNCTGKPYATLWGACGIGPGSRVLLGSPLGSGMGQIVTSALLARLGATVSVMDLFDATTALRLTELVRPTHWWLVPTMVQLMLADPVFPDTDISSVDYVICAGSPVPANLVRRLAHDHGVHCIPTYGFVDGGLCSARADDPLDRRAETVGRPDPRVNEIRIVGPDGAVVPAGQPGEVCARGPFSPLGYLRAPELNRLYRSDAEGWVRSGDLGVLDDDGYLRIVGRIKDVIVRGGMNISAAEVEEILTAHPHIVQAACVGYPDPVMGERMCAFLVLRTGSEPPTVRELANYLSECGLMRNKAPERLEVIEAMPTNPTGKILKRVLRDRLESMTPAAPSNPVS